MHQRENKKKKEEAKAQKAELAQKFAEMQNYEKALEATEKAEEIAAEKNKKAKKQKEQDQKTRKELGLKASVRRVGYHKMKELQAKDEEAETQAQLKEGKEKVEIRKIQKANRECKNACIGGGKERESSKRPPFLGCYMDNNETSAFNVEFAAYNDNSIGSCNSKCILQNPLNRFMALQDHMCFCATENEPYDRYGVASEDNCILPCPGNADELCGGPLVNRVYGLQISAGLYGWSGYVKNASRPIVKTNFNFDIDTCQCFGTPLKPVKKLAPHNQVEELSL